MDLINKIDRIGSLKKLTESNKLSILDGFLCRCIKWIKNNRDEYTSIRTFFEWQSYVIDCRSVRYLEQSW